tara:strand:+ start:98 stop:1285 length:1188 start_codon:yes stop_codon:yes gene_type:complete
MIERYAYIRAVGGISGDMLLGALIDLGADVDFINEQLNSLNIGKIELEFYKGTRKGVSGIGLSPLKEVLLSDSYTFKQFIKIIEDSHLTSSVRKKALLTFKNLLKAEQIVHGSDEVELHELGSIDTIIDVVGVVSGFESLKIDRMFCSALPAGCGFIKSGHGLMSIPAPAVLELIKMSNSNLLTNSTYFEDSIEMITPTGVALATTLAEFSDPIMNVMETGFGLGTRDIEKYPNVVEIWMGESMSNSVTNKYSLLETNIDDMSSELIGYVQERLFDSGVLDVWTSPIYMKKNRPAVKISCILPVGLEEKIARLLMKETSTFGIRVTSISRYEADRKNQKINTEFGGINVKLKIVDGKVIDVYPEYEDCRRIAVEENIPLQKVIRLAQLESNRLLD